VTRRIAFSRIVFFAHFTLLEQCDAAYRFFQFYISISGNVTRRIAFLHIVFLQFQIREFRNLRCGGGYSRTSSASDPPAPRKWPPPNAPKFCTPFWGAFLDIFPPLLVAAIGLALSLWGVEGQKRCLWGACKGAPT
jgi:hypothetical protein